MEIHLLQIFLFEKEKVRHPTDCLWPALSSSVFPRSLPHSHHNCDQEYHCFDKVMPAVVVMINLRFGQNKSNKSDPRMLCANIVIRNLCVFEINLFHIKKSFRRLFFLLAHNGKMKNIHVYLGKPSSTKSDDFLHIV